MPSQLLVDELWQKYEEVKEANELLRAQVETLIVALRMVTQVAQEALAVTK